MRLDVGESKTTTFTETAGGTKVKRIIERVPTKCGTVEKQLLIDPPDGQPFTIEAGRYNRRRARLIAKLHDRVDEFKIAWDRETVPVNIARQGNPVIATYLYAVHDWSEREVAELLDLRRNTVRQYMAAVSSKRR